MTNAEQTRSTTPRKRRRLLAALLVALGVLLASLLRWCGGLGLGPGAGTDPGIDAAPRIVSPVPGDAGLGTRDAAQAAGPCALSLSSRGLTVNGRSATIDQSVRACRQAGGARLEVTGGARTGTYRELMDALRTADIPVDERAWTEQP